MTDKAVQRGKLVAADRYVVFVADMYGAATRPPDFDAAAALANPLRADAMEQRKRVKAAFETMIAEANQRNLIDDRRAAVGFCFGGGNVLELVRDSADLAAAVPVGLWHHRVGAPWTTSSLALIAPLLAGSAVLKAEMNAAEANWQMMVFSGVLHAYTDQGADVPGIAGWNEPASRQTYALTHQFLADAFAARL